MSVSSLLGLAHFSRLTSSADDDWVDRVNHVYTVVLLIIFAVFISGGQYVGNPIECWTPAHFTGAYTSYARSYCWVKNTYYIPMGDAIPLEKERRESEELTYYQWVPIILMFMAFLFKFPCFVWRMFNGWSAINLDKIVSLASSTQIGSPQDRQKAIAHITEYMDRWLEAHRHYQFNVLVRLRQRASKVLCFLWGKRDGTYLIGLYLFVKALYVVNVVCQFFVLNAFMGGWYSVYGLDVLGGVVNDHSWSQSSRFPRVTLCDFDIRQLNNVQRYSVQCVLPINMFNEKVFIFLWFWLCGVAALTCGNFLFWIWRAFNRHSRVSYIKKYLLLLSELKGEEDKRLAKKFVLNYLRDDGIFVLRLVAKNSTDIVLSDLIGQLWKTFMDKPLVRKGLNGDAEYNHDSLA